MPQLDKVSFLSQFLWLSFFFWGFYIIALKSFLPKMSRILKYRKKRLHSHEAIPITTNQQSSVQGANSLERVNNSIQSTESVQVRSSTQNLISIGLRASTACFKQNLQKTEDWLINNINQTNQRELKNTNNMYLHSLAEKLLSHKLLMQKCFLDFSSTIYVSVLKEKIKIPVFRSFFKHQNG